MKNKEILKALKELNLNNRGCEPTAKLTTNVTTLKGLNQYSGKILFSTPFPYRFCDSKSSYLFNPFGAAAAIISFAVGFHPRLLKYHPFRVFEEQIPISELIFYISSERALSE